MAAIDDKLREKYAFDHSVTAEGVQGLIDTLGFAHNKGLATGKVIMKIRTIKLINENN